MQGIVIYLICMSIVGLCMMGVDKARAKKRAWCIPERRLFLCSLLGGSLGTWAGMYLFRHKTRHGYFVVGMPLIFFLQTAAIFYLIKA